MLSNSYNAEYGQASGAIVSVLTRSGTNQYAGPRLLLPPQTMPGMRRRARQARLAARNEVEPAAADCRRHDWRPPRS